MNPPVASPRSSARRLPLALAFAALLASCGDSAPPDASSASFPDEAFLVATSESGALRVALRTSPTQPPVHGTLVAELRVTDAATGADRDGLTITMVPFMPAMGHGAAVDPTVAAKGGGRYLASDVSLFMAGRWELRTELVGAAHDRVVFAFDVP